MDKSNIYINENDKYLYERGITFCNLNIVISKHMPEKMAIIMLNDYIFSDQIIIRWKDDKTFSYKKFENKFKYNFEPFVKIYD